MVDGTVVRYGTDSSGRPIYMSKYMRDWTGEFLAACHKRGFTPTITQGAWMSKVPGGGADDSAGYHDKGGCLDFRIWDRTKDEREFMLREARRRAAAAYLRGPAYGTPSMEEHMHLTLAQDPNKADGAAAQWTEYLAGGDGLVGSLPDQFWRPSPLVKTWSMPPVPTPNITAVLTAPTRASRKAALHRVIDHGSPSASKWAQNYLAAIIAIEAAQKRASAARSELKKLERR